MDFDTRMKTALSRGSWNLKMFLLLLLFLLLLSIAFPHPLTRCSCLPQTLNVTNNKMMKTPKTVPVYKIQNVDEVIIFKIRQVSCKHVRFYSLLDFLKKVSRIKVVSV